MAIEKVRLPRCTECNRRLKERDGEHVCVNKKCKTNLVAETVEEVSTPLVQVEPDKVEKVVERELPKVPEKAVIKPMRVDRVPNLSMFPEVTVYAYKVGPRGYRYSTSMPTHTKADWEKKMTGRIAHQFLRTVKSRNRNGRLESKVLPK